MRTSSLLACLVTATLATGCGGDEPPAPAPAFNVTDRAPSTREPVAPGCDVADAIRCALPWPSNAFTVLDRASATGLRVSLPAQAAAEGDSVTQINRADGFSRVSPVMTAFAGEVDPASLNDSVRLYAVGTDGALAAVPLRFRVVAGTGADVESLIVAYPRVPMAAATDHVAVVLDSLRLTSGTPPRASSLTRASLGLAAPTSETEARYRGYHAPTRAMLQRAGVELSRVLRVWDFTTRSREQPTRVLRAMRERLFAALDAGTIRVSVRRARALTGGAAAVEVLGTLENVPDFVDANGDLARDAMGEPRVADGAEGVHEVPFRVLVPRGTGDYRVAMFGHGTGGDENDDSFDQEITGGGAAKVGIRFQGWNGSEVINTFARFERLFRGAERSTAALLQSVADGQALQRALTGTSVASARTALVARVLAAPMIGDIANPAAGRYPRYEGVIWTGGSLGGTMGLVYTRAEPRITAAVLNVAGAAWTHYLTGSSLYPAVRLGLISNYGSDLDIQIAVGITQLNFDDIDGAVWDGANPERPMLFQQSMGDPVLPNIGTEIAAASARATQVGAVLSPLPDAMRSNEVTNGSALTQYRVPSTVMGNYDVHGFAARGTPAGVAARAQIVGFITSVWAGTARITVPAGCQMNTPAGSCDFSMSR